ncbi:MAG: class I SAM-dependent methyltransferase family protein [Candidatus Methanoperedens sp.]|nr:class I SAM-dependent methyltransferase family protein [Candidatus Methanoperedens sp.]
MSLRDLLENKLPDEELLLVPQGFEVIGDIAIIIIPPSLDYKKNIIAQALMSHRQDIRSILRKISKLESEKRIGDFELLLGSSTETIHRENGCIFHLDIAKTFFSGKLAYERARIAESVRDGEDILVLFAGVGPFLIQIKKKRNVNITGIESNPVACAYLRKNALANNIDTGIILGDANSAGNLFKKKFDRIVMPTPYGHDHFLNVSSTVLKPGGLVHFYTFKKDFEIGHFKRVLEERGWKINFIRNCGAVAPRVNRYVFDLQLH